MQSTSIKMNLAQLRSVPEAVLQEIFRRAGEN
jgi:hypothetical protein